VSRGLGSVGSVLTATAYCSMEVAAFAYDRVVAAMEVRKYIS
jgi:hypothetical protein